MSAGKARSVAAYDGLRRMFVFIFYIAGLLFGERILAEYPLDWSSRESMLFVYSVIFGAVLLLSVSLWGSALLPLCSMCFGAVTGDYASSIVRAFWEAGSRDWRGLIINAAAVPVFFVAAVRGMRCSASLGAIIDRHSPAIRAEYNREYITLAVILLTGIVFLYFAAG